MNAMTISPYRTRGRFTDLDQIVNNLFSPAQRGDSDHGITTRFPAIDIVETKHSFEVKADLPGVKDEDISVSVKEGVLTIETESVNPGEEATDRKIISNERRTGKYYRSLKLGSMIDDTGIQAGYENGVLTLTLPKTEKAEAKRIPVNANRVVV